MADSLGSNIRSYRKNKGFTQEELGEAIEICDWCESVISAYASKSEYATDHHKWILRKLNFSKMSAYVRAGENEKAKETRDDYLKMIREKGMFTEEELRSVEKEFNEGIYIL